MPTHNPDRLDIKRPIAMRLTARERAQALRLADAEDRSLASFARVMYLRGLSGYLADQTPQQPGKPGRA